MCVSPLVYPRVQLSRLEHSFRFCFHSLLSDTSDMTLIYVDTLLGMKRYKPSLLNHLVYCTTFMWQSFFL